jgi:toxin-antitoxin system PIN domain toxin
MRCVDVNVLVYAHRPESPRHEEWAAWLDDARQAAEPLGLITSVATGFVRVVTHARVFQEPTPLPIALEFIDVLAGSPSCRWVEPGPRHWELVAELCRATDAVGNRVPDAALAAIAIEVAASFVTADRGFARYPGLRVDSPI